MNVYGAILRITALTFLVLGSLATQVESQEVKVQVSDREAYVGAPIVLQIEVINAANYEPPDIFEIDGCDVRAAGAPSRRSQITIINGRRSESQTVTMQYLITPRREGRFEIPELRITVEGTEKTIASIPFVATKSESGDLLFAEIIGDKKTVYVGQPLNLKLKLWIKPYRDRENRIELDEGQMWQMLSGGTSWGLFSDRFQELAENRQRPGGKSVLRDDGEGNQRGYFLYVIDATIYPTRPGKIDGSDIQVVLDYPLEFGRVRDPIDEFFDDRGLGGSSLLQQMMEDDFGGSRFGRRLTVTKSRPVVADVKVDSTEVLPIPSEGRPADYRGAVGRYRIVTDAQPRIVDAGDPITLRIAVKGNGPMELVQAPPLHEIESLTQGFKITDQSIGGYVQGDRKEFETTIRPRNSDVTEIPPIPFSFFDPVKEQFQTVYSRPISISVNPAETLSLDSIVSNSQPQAGSEQIESQTGPDFRNRVSSDVLLATSSTSMDWKFFAIVPALVWLIIAVAKLAKWGFSNAPDLRSPKRIAQDRLSKSRNQQDIGGALVDFLAQVTQKMVPTPTPISRASIEAQKQAVGRLRILGHQQEANEVESFFHQLNGSPINGETVGQDQIGRLVDAANTLIAKIEVAFKANHELRVRSRRNKKNLGSKEAIVGSLLGFCLLFPGLCNACSLETSSESQWEAVFAEANDAYLRAEEILPKDQAEAKDLFSQSADKYQWLIEQGVDNGQLHLNLGNAQLRVGKLGHAIASYHRALRLIPNDAQTIANLRFAQDQLELDDESYEGVSEQSWGASIQVGASRFVRQVGTFFVTLVFAIASIGFWLCLTARTLQWKLPVLQLALLPLTLMLIAGFCLYASDRPSETVAILVSDQVTLRSGDGEEFEVLETIDSAVGLTSRVLDQRDGWLELSIEGKQSGWTPDTNVELID